tara:strand:+ start:428 stop:4216 length:3789 start_codon:yes stop_codon:yes gene_type:complete
MAPFELYDFYTGSGTHELVKRESRGTTAGGVFPNVTKFTANSLYTSDADNVPLNELEKRTDLLYEQLGYPTSSIGGVYLTVSSVIGKAETDNIEENAYLLASGNHFLSLSSVAERLPRVVRHPIRIEVATHGDLGTLSLKNITCTDGGSIEIINRSYARVYSASANQVASTEGIHVSSVDLSGAWSNASALGVDDYRYSPVLSGAGDDRISGHVYSLMSPRGGVGAASSIYCTVDGGFYGASANVFKLPVYESTTAAAELALDNTVYDYTQDGANGSIGRQHPTLDMGTKHNKITGIMCGNHLKKLEIENCTGPIYIRGFIVDGARTRNSGIEVRNSNVIIENCGTIRNKQHGLLAHNSDITMTRGFWAYRNYETATTVKNSDAAGIKLVNSNLTVSGEFAGSSLVNGPHGSHHLAAYDFVVNSARNGYGVILENSKIDGGFSREHLGTGTSHSYASSGVHLGATNNFLGGIKLTNSILDLSGAVDVYGNFRGLEAHNSQVFVDEFIAEMNQKEGVLLDKSNFVYNKNFRKTVAFDSLCTPRSQTRFYANGQHLVATNNSSFVPLEVSGMYGPDDKSDVDMVGAVLDYPNNMGYIRCDGAHGITASGATGALKPEVEISNNSYARLINLTTERQHGNTTNKATKGAAISVTDNSTALIQGTRSCATRILGPSGSGEAAAHAKQQQLAGIYAGDNSKIEFNGPTMIARYGVGCLAENNSTVKFGPHRSAEGGLDVSAFNLYEGQNQTSVEIQSFRGCLVANNNSNLIMEDLGEYSTWSDSPATSQYGYDTNALGTSGFTWYGSMQFYPNPNLASHAHCNNNAGQLAGTQHPPTMTSAVTTGRVADSLINVPYNYGIVNPFNFNASSYTYGGFCVRAFNNSNVTAKNVHFLTGYGNIGTAHLGGCSGLFWDRTKTNQNAGGSNLSHNLPIWHVDDSSRLKSTYCGVSGMDGSSTMYHGPSAVYVSAGLVGNEVGAGYEPAFAMPSGTPDTGSLSVLDYFGYASHGTSHTHPGKPRAPYAHIGYAIGEQEVLASYNNPNTPTMMLSGVDQSITVQRVLAQNMGMVPEITHYKYGQDSFQNNGPFRLFVTPKSEAKFLLTPASGMNAPTHLDGYKTADNGFYGEAYQMMAQGYNPSGFLFATTNLSGAGYTVSSLHPNLLNYQRNGGSLAIGANNLETNLQPSGYYYTNQFVSEIPTQIVVDEFSANIFGNVKNLSIGLSNRPKRATIIRSHNESRTGADVETTEASKIRGAGLGSLTEFDLRSNN